MITNQIIRDLRKLVHGKQLNKNLQNMSSFVYQYELVGSIT